MSVNAVIAVQTICYIYLISFTLSQLRTWNNVQTYNAHNSQTDWQTDRNSQIGRVPTHNSQIILACNSLTANSQTPKSQTHIWNHSNLGCVSTVIWTVLSGSCWSQKRRSNIYYFASNVSFLKFFFSKKSISKIPY